MAYRVELTDRAFRDLEGILNGSLYDGLEEKIESLTEFPARCPVIPEDRRYRHLIYQSYRIIFAIDKASSTVNVLAVYHGARDRFDRST